MKTKIVASALLMSLTATLANANTYVNFKTTQGDIQVELFDKEAPISAKNFADYAKSGFYNGTIFHRVIPGFVIQGGGFDSAMVQKETKAPIKNEAKNGLLNKRGTLSMARTQNINSATSQFFVNLVDNDMLDPSSRDYGYAVFGKVTKGLEIVDKIAKVPTGRSGYHSDVPVKPIIILSTTVKNSKD